MIAAFPSPVVATLWNDSWICGHRRNEFAWDPRDLYHCPDYVRGQHVGDHRLRDKEGQKTDWSVGDGGEAGTDLLDEWNDWQ